MINNTENDKNEFVQYVKRWFINGFIIIFLFWVLGHILHALFKPKFEEREPYWHGIDSTRKISDRIYDYNTGKVTNREYGPSKESDFEYPDTGEDIDIETAIDLILD
jgi:hypothetical protein